LGDFGALYRDWEFLLEKFFELYWNRKEIHFEKWGLFFWFLKEQNEGSVWLDFSKLHFFFLQ